jgi:hypothetical protein
MKDEQCKLVGDVKNHMYIISMPYVGMDVLVILCHVLIDPHNLHSLNVHLVQS